MTPSGLTLVAAAILGFLGSCHLMLTLVGSKLLPRDPGLRPAMERTAPKITTQTTIWRAWIGFNLSHSMGAILFGLVYGHLAWFRAEVLFESTFLQLVGLAVLIAFVVMSKLYWFATPLAASTVALACYAAALVLAASG